MLSEKLSIQLEALYNKNNIYGLYIGYYELFIDHSMLTPSVGIKYGYNKGKIRPSFSAGLTANFMLNINIYGLVHNEPGQPANETSMNPKSLVMATELWGGFVQLGCNYNIIKNIDMFTNVKYSYCSGLAFSNKQAIHVQTTVGTINFSSGFYF